MESQDFYSIKQMKFHYLNKVKIIQKVVVINLEKKILVIRRRLKDLYRPGAWDLPGGNIDNEDRQNYQNGTNLAYEAALREVREESGLLITDLELLAIKGGVNKENILIYFVAYQAKTNSVEVKLSSEHIDYQWIGIEDYQNLDFGNEGNFFKDLINKIKL